jgi:Zn-dependent protease with chaperone function
VAVLVYLPATELFRALAEWCWHDVLPVLALHLGISGHALAHAPSIAPGLALATSLLWLVGGLVRAWLALRRHLKTSIGEGPAGSTIVDEAQILVGATRIGRGRTVISHGALRFLDAEELAASLAREEAHIRRRHRPLLFAGSVLAALARVLPGTRTAERELAFQLERDADEYAVRQTRDSLALASAICKAAGGVPGPTLSGSAVADA